MGGFTLLSMFVGAEIGRLGAGPDPQADRRRAVVPGVGDALTVTPAAVQQAVSKLMNG